MIIQAEYVSEWTEGTVITPASLNLVTGEVDIAFADCDANAYEHLIKEYLLVGGEHGFRYEVNHGHDGMEISSDDLTQISQYKWK